MSLKLFMSAGVRDARERLARLDAIVFADESRLWEELKNSAAGRAVSAMASAIERAVPDSVALERYREADRGWRQLSRAARFRLMGTVVVVAVIMHLTLAAASNPVGAWWLILPALAAGFGLSLLVLSLSDSGQDATR